MIAFAPYQPADRAACLALFDANAPAFFSPNERDDYLTFLEEPGAGYEVCRSAGRVVGAFGVQPSPPDACHLRWIMLAPDAQGRGIGSAIMARVAEKAGEQGRVLVRIAASHKSAPFFARFGARIMTTTPDGWGPGMHRVDMEWRPE